MSTHEQYMTVGYVLAEYATKAALSCFLKEKKARDYAEILCALGFDVQDVGLWTVGKSVIKLGVPPSMVLAKALGQTSTAEKLLGGHMQAGSRHELLGKLFDRVQRLATMPPATAAQHAAFASVLAQDPSHKVKHGEALRIYGGNPWYEVGALGTTAATVQASYESWRRWGQRYWPLLQQMTGEPKR
jgi:hypothetical protein